MAPLRANGRGRVATAGIRATGRDTTGIACPDSAKEEDGKRATLVTKGGGMGRTRREGGLGGGRGDRIGKMEAPGGTRAGRFRRHHQQEGGAGEHSSSRSCQ